MVVEVATAVIVAPDYSDNHRSRNICSKSLEKINLSLKSWNHNINNRKGYMTLCFKM